VTVAVVIPCRNEAAHIGPLLDALVSQTRLPDELIIIDDCSTDDTRIRVEQWQAAHPATAVTVLPGRGLGPGPALNDGIRTTHADIIIRFDAHALPSPDYVARSLDALEDDAVGVAGGVWHVEPGADTPMARAIAQVAAHPFGSGGALYRHADAGGNMRVSVETVPFGAFRRPGREIDIRADASLKLASARSVAVFAIEHHHRRPPDPKRRTSGKRGQAPQRPPRPRSRLIRMQPRRADIDH